MIAEIVCFSPLGLPKSFMVDIRYPIYPQNRLLDRVAMKVKSAGFGFCTVCGKASYFIVKGESLRESCHCVLCGSSNRQRQLAYVICKVSQLLTGRKAASLRHLAETTELAIYNTEANGSLHEAFRGAKSYHCSEYFGPERSSGEIINGVRHEDLMALSFADSIFDLVISADVLEHVPDPYRAHKEIYRVLKSNGRHIFTVPFYQTEFLDEHRTRMAPNGSITYLMEPEYHSDPLRPEGALVHTVFSLEMLVKLAGIGFRTNLWHLYKPHYGILGPNAIVFEAIKQ